MERAGAIYAVPLIRYDPATHEDATYEFPVGLGVLAPAEVGESPGRVPQHAHLVRLVEQRQEGPEGSLLQNVVSALRTVSRNVSECPDGLLSHVEDGRREELDEDGDGAGLNDDLRVLGCTGGDVGESPGSLELEERGKGGEPGQLRVDCSSRIGAHLDHGVLVAEELNEASDDSTLDDLLNGRVALLTQELPEPRRCVELLIRLVGEHSLDHRRELLLELSAHTSSQLRSEVQDGRGGALTAESTAPSSSDSPPLAAETKFLLLATLSSLFCFLISTCASSRLLLSSVPTPRALANLWRREKKGQCASQRLRRGCRAGEEGLTFLAKHPLGLVRVAARPGGRKKGWRFSKDLASVSRARSLGRGVDGRWIEDGGTYAACRSLMAGREGGRGGEGGGGARARKTVDCAEDLLCSFPLRRTL